MSKTGDNYYAPSPAWTDGIDNVCADVSSCSTDDTKATIVYSYPDCTAWVCGRCGAYYIDFDDYAEHTKNCKVEYRPVLDVIHALGTMTYPTTEASLAHIATALERIANALEKMEK